MSKDKIAAALFAVLTACIRAKAAPLNGVPNGHLYAELMGHFELEEWNKLISLFTSSGLITKTNHLLKITANGEKVHAELEKIFAEGAAV